MVDVVLVVTPGDVLLGVIFAIACLFSALLWLLSTTRNTPRPPSNE